MVNVLISERDCRSHIKQDFWNMKTKMAWSLISENTAIG